MYYAVTDYSDGNYRPYRGYLYRCNIDGSNCTQINSVDSYQNINAIG